MIRVVGHLMVYACCTFAFIMGSVGCNSVPTDSKIIELKFFPDQTKKYFRGDSIVIFNIQPGHVVEFSGKRKTVFHINKQLASEEINEPYYRRITTLPDTLISVDDSVRGYAKFTLDDLIPNAGYGWDVLFKYIKDTTSFMNQVLSEHIDTVVLNSIYSYQAPSQLTASDKGSLIASLNAILSDYKFYNNNMESIQTEVFVSEVQDYISVYLNLLIDAGIFIDSTGDVNPKKLSLQEKERLKWFNWFLIVWCIDNIYIAEDHGKMFNRYPSSGVIYPYKFQQGKNETSLKNSTFFRFLEMSSSGMSQLLYVNKNDVVIKPSLTTIAKFFYVTGTYWDVSDIIWIPSDIPFLSVRDFVSMVIPGKGTVEFEDFIEFDSIQQISMWYFDFKTLYTLGGYCEYNGQRLRVSGTVEITMPLVRNAENKMKTEQAYVKGLYSRIHVLGEGIDGNVFEYTEILDLQSDDGVFKNE